MQDEIGAFGGDPGRVTLGGESGGSIGTCAQLLSPAARGLFQQAVLQSGSCDTAGPAITVPGLPPTRFLVPGSDVEAAGVAAAQRLGCSGPGTVECLRALPVDRILGEGANFVAAGYGTPLLPTEPAAALRAGEFTAMPVLSGYNRDEGTVLAQTAELMGQPITDENLEPRVAELFGEWAPEILARYPRADYPSAGFTYGAIVGDAFFACPQLVLDGFLAAQGPVYGYEFADRTSPGYVPILPGYEPVGASHAAELPYLFDVRDKPIDFSGNPVPLTAAQRELGNAMIRYWTRFMRGSDPNGAGDPTWDRFADGRTVHELAPEGFRPLDAAQRHRCGFWSGG